MREWIADGTFMQRALDALQDQERRLMAYEKAPQPAQRTWVGLTDVEWMNIVNKDQAWFGQRPDEVAHEVAKLVEAKLKEKNGIKENT